MFVLLAAMYFLQDSGSPESKKNYSLQWSVGLRTHFIVLFYSEKNQSLQEPTSMSMQRTSRGSYLELWPSSSCHEWYHQRHRFLFTVKDDASVQNPYNHKDVDITCFRSRLLLLSALFWHGGGRTRTTMEENLPENQILVLLVPWRAQPLKLKKQ